MPEKYAIAVQAAGSISFNGAILDVSTYSPTVHAVNIPSGMINIGGQGKGYTLPAQTPYIFTPTLTDDTYVLYANAPTDFSGVVTLAHDDFTSYISGGGDNANRRAFCYFRVRGVILENDSIVTFQSADMGIPLDPDASSGDGHFVSEVFDKLKKIGFFLNETSDVGFVYRGQGYDEAVTFDSNVATWDLIYKNTDGSYYQGLDDDTNAQKVLGLADVNRDEIVGNNFVITSGIVNVGTTILPTVDYPAGTYIYLSGTSAGTMVRDFDSWVASTVYDEGDRIRETGSGSIDYIFEVTSTGGGTSGGGGSEPTWTDLSGLGDSVVDNTVTWTIVAFHESSFLNPNRKIRVGIALGSGVMLLQSAAVTAGGTVEDHDESSYAHVDIQDAINMHGIYVRNLNQGKTNFVYRGQVVDEKATFSGIFDGEQVLVYRNGSSGNYEKALADGSLKQNVVGMSRNVVSGVGQVIGQGFVSANTASSGFAFGDPLYLSSVTAGGYNTIITPVKIGIIGLVGADTGDETGGMIFLKYELSETVVTAGLEKGTLGLTGYDIIIGNLTDVSGGDATHTIDNWLTASDGLKNGDRVYIFRDLNTETDQNITFDDVKIYFDPEATITQGSAGDEFIFSGDRIEIFNGRFAGFTVSATENILVSGAGCDFRIVEGSIDIFDVTGAGSIVRSANSGIKTATWKIDTATGDITFNDAEIQDIIVTNLTASRVIQTDGSKKLESSGVTNAELGLLNGLTGPTGSGDLVASAAPTISGVAIFSGAVSFTAAANFSGENASSVVGITQSPGNNSTRLATTAYADNAGAAGIHNVKSTGPHAQSGLNVGDVLRASATDAFDFTTLAISETSGTLAINRGGTNAVGALNNGRVMASSGGAIVEDDITTTELGLLNAMTGFTGTGATFVKSAGPSLTGRLNLGGRIEHARATGGSITLGLTHSVYLANTTATVTLPENATDGTMYFIKNVGTGVVTIARTGADTIDGKTSLLLDVQYMSVTVVSDGANWFIV